MKIRSCKAKGRKLCQEVKTEIHRLIPDIRDEDVRINPSSCPGEDLHLSPGARRHLPLAIECKNQETTSVWKWIAQSKKYGKDGRCPVVVFSRNREPEPYAIISLKDLLMFVSESVKSETSKDFIGW